MNNEQNQLNFESLVNEAINADTDDFFELARIFDLNPLTDFAGADLHETNLRGKDLQGANFKRTNFSSANLSNTDLNGNIQHPDYPSPDTVITVFNPSDNLKNVDITAIIDTAAMKTCLPEQEIEKLGKLNYSLVNARSANNSVIEIKTYLVNIQLADNMFSNIEVVAIPKDYGLIGRDILNSVKIVFDGPNLQWILQTSENS